MGKIIIQKKDKKWIKSSCPIGISELEILNNLSPRCYNELKSLALVNYNFVEFPKIISKLTQLEYLNLGGNNIAKIPPKIQHLKQLQILTLQENKIAKIPKYIAELPKLRLLALYANPIESIPRNLCNKLKYDKYFSCDLRNNDSFLKICQKYASN